MAETLLYTYFAPTGSLLRTKTRHYIHGAHVAGFHRLKMVAYGNGGGVHILRFDQYGNEIADSWHDSIDKAFDDAEREMEVRRDEWQPAYPPGA